MVRGTLRLRAIALVAAYALALQGLLSAFVPVAVALPVGVLCSGQVVDMPADPAGHEPSCKSACAMLGGVAGPLPPDVVIARQAAGRTHQATPPVVLAVASPRGVQTARAPPSV